MVLVDRYSEEIDEEGDTVDTDAIWQNSPCTFRELVHLMTRGGFREASNWPANGRTYEWYSTGFESDYTTGNDTQETIHYSRSNAPRSAKYWRKAAMYAGIVK